MAKCPGIVGPASHAASDVGFFYCGPRALSKTLHVHCRRIGWSFLTFDNDADLWLAELE